MCLHGRPDPDSWKALSSEVKEVREGEADDEAMGTHDPSRKQENSDVSPVFSIGPGSTLTWQKMTTLHWRGIRMASSSQLRHFGALTNERDVTILEAAVDGTLRRNTEGPAAAKTSRQGPEDNGDASDSEDVLGLKAEIVKEEPEKEAETDGGMEVDAPAGAQETAPTLGEGEEATQEVSATDMEERATSKEATPTVHEDEGENVKVEEAAKEETAEVKVEQAEQVNDETVEVGKPPRPATPELPVSLHDPAGIHS